MIVGRYHVVVLKVPQTEQPDPATWAWSDLVLPDTELIASIPTNELIYDDETVESLLDGDPWRGTR